MALGPEFDPGNVCLDTLWVAERIGEAGGPWRELLCGPSCLQGTQAGWGLPGCVCGVGEGWGGCILANGAGLPLFLILEKSQSSPFYLNSTNYKMLRHLV